MSLSLTGCMVGPNYHAPKMEVEPSFANEAPATTRPSQVTAEGQSIDQWWKTFNDPELDSLIERAAKSNLDLRLAAARVREARARRAVAAGGQYPEANVNAGYSRQRYSQNAAPFNAFNVPGFPWEFNLFQMGFDASWEVDVFGGLRRNLEAASADYAAGIEGRRGIRLSVVAEVARNYVELRAQQQRLAIAERNLQVQRQTLDLTIDRRNKGVATQLDVSRAASQVAKTEAQVPALQYLQWQAIHRIAVLLGQQPQALTQELSAERPIPVPPASVAVGVPAELLRRRPDIRQAERELAAATARVGVATANLYPRFSLTGTFGMQSSEIGHMLDWKSRAFTIGPAVSWPIFDAGRLRALLDASNAQEQQAMANYEKTVLTALEETHDAIVAFATEQDRRRALADAVHADQEATDLAEQSYRQGVADFLTVLDAERSLYQSQDALAESDQAVTTALVALYKALGGGWEVGSAPAPGTQARQNGPGDARH